MNQYLQIDEGGSIAWPRFLLAQATLLFPAERTVPARAAEPRRGVAQCAGFSLHAGIGVEADQRAKLERLARYVSRPSVAIERLALTTQRQVRYRLKTAYRDGTTQIVLEPVDFMARLAALVPPPRSPPPATIEWK